MDIFEKNSSFAFDTKIESAYIITVKNNKNSEKMTDRCSKSCDKFGMPWKRWDAFDGTEGEIIIPEHLKNKDWLKWLKVVNCMLVDAEIATILSHIGLWAHCVEINKPIVILEHDSVLIEDYAHHLAVNSIVYLGSEEQAKNNFKFNSIPMMWGLGENFRFINRTHAYSIDPLIAKKLLGNIILSGIHCSVDVFIRSDIFTQVQFGIFAIDMPQETTCVGRATRNQDEHKQKINYKLIF